MHCKNCDHVLFDLSDPVCPECGHPFDVTEYRFQRGSVCFACPYCDQEYEGNDERGLPSPREFSCVSCGRGVAVGSMRVMPRTSDAVGVPGVYATSPWEKRGRTGLGAAWIHSVRMIMFQPGVFFRLHLDPSNREAWRFALITAYFGPGIGLVLLGVLTAAASLGRWWGSGPLAVVENQWVSYALWCAALATPPVLMVLCGPVMGVIAHASLPILTHRRRSIGYSCRAALYAMAPLVLCAVPICLAQVGMVWYVVALVIGIRRVHGISAWKAVCAVLWFPLLVGAIGVLLLLNRSAGDVAGPTIVPPSPAPTTMPLAWL